ncbi:MAG: bifunctional sugar-1-phosphate nucleotidylyltransferase/acetyltransferase [Thermoproteota archaeon]
MGLHAVVLAAGRGERLWPLTSTRPKPLIPLPGGETVLSRLVRQLLAAPSVLGVTVVVSPSSADLVRKELEKVGVPVQLVVQEEQLGTGHAALVGLQSLPRGVDEVLIVNGDVVLESSDVRRLAEMEGEAVLSAREEKPWEFGVMRLNGNFCLEEIVEKPSPGNAPSNYVNVGAYKLRFEDLYEELKKLQPSARGEYEITDAVSRLSKRRCVKVIVAEEGWVDVGRPWDLVRAYYMVLRERLAGYEALVEGEVAPSAEVRGPVYISRNAVVHSYSIIEGPAWIEGEVGPFARIRPYTFMLRGSKAGTHTELKSSILMENAKVPHLNYVGDSVLGEQVNMGAGAVTANLRFDHATIKVTLKGKRVDTGLRKLGAIIGGYAQIGVNVSILPGIRIGAWSWIYPGLTVNKDVPDCVMAVPGPKGEIEFRDITERVECRRNP